MSSLQRIVANQLRQLIEAQKHDLSEVRRERSEHIRKASELASEVFEIEKAISETTELLESINETQHGEDDTIGTNN